MKVQEFIDNWDKIKKDIISKMDKCAKCKNIIDETHYINKKPVCSDCYFDAFGEEIEKHPICMPRLHR